MEGTTPIEAVIGLEVHIQLSTKSKAFCGDDSSYGGEPNTHVSAISLAHPGTLPRINEQHVVFATKLGLALGCTINPRSFFDRKHYFYADLPKGFQTTQDGEPICIGGSVDLAPATERIIRIHHIHMEEDAGKSLHDGAHVGSLIDFNRAGVPLLEMVTEPDFRSSEEVYIFINKLRRLVRYLEISDGNMEEGSIRCDCNVSVRPTGFKGLNPRCEVKNINSARFARKAVDYEIERQSDLMSNGEKVDQQTREFLPEKGITKLLRGKEDAHDYRYFPEPDLPPILMSVEKIEEIKQSIPTLPEAYFAIFKEEYDLATNDIELIIADHQRASYFKSLLDQTKADAKGLAKLFINRILPHLDEHRLDAAAFPISPALIEQYLELIATKKISASVAARKVWPILLDEPQDVAQLVTEMNLNQNSDSHMIVDLARAVLAENPDQVTKYLKGKKGVVKFFIGQLMRNSKGKANPAMASKTIEKLLDDLKNGTS